MRFAPRTSPDFLKDIPRRLLTIAVRRMPAERGEWGAAMLAELAQLQHPFTRWRFALGCARVALFPPRKGRFIMNVKAKRIINVSGAALISLLTVVPFAILELRNNSGSRNFSHFPFPLFIFLWLLSIAFIIGGAPIVRTVRAGGSLLAHPVTLLFRFVLLALLAIAWVGVIRDQMPCFLGVPNCD